MPPLISRLGRWLGAAPLRAFDAERKASATGPLIELHGQGRPLWTPRDYAALAKEGFSRNAVVYRAVRMITEAAGSLTWLAYEGERELDTHPLLKLLERPNARQSGADFLEALYRHLLNAGNAYVEQVSVDRSLRELHVLRSDRMKVVPGPDGELFVSERGTWTVVLTDKRGVACMVLAGEDWEQVPAPAAPEF